MDHVTDNEERKEEESLRSRFHGFTVPHCGHRRGGGGGGGVDGANWVDYWDRNFSDQLGINRIKSS